MGMHYFMSEYSSLRYLADDSSSSSFSNARRTRQQRSFEARPKLAIIPLWFSLAIFVPVFQPALQSLRLVLLPDDALQLLGAVFLHPQLSGCDWF